MAIELLITYWRLKVTEVFPKKINQEKVQAGFRILASLVTSLAEDIKKEKEIPSLMPIQKPSEQKINI